MNSNAIMPPLPASAHSGTDARGADRPSRKHRLRKSLTMTCLAFAAILTATGVMTGVTPHSPSAAASAATSNWVASAGTLSGAVSADPATAAHFFNSPGSYAVGDDAAASPVPQGYATTPVLNYTSCADFQNDLSSGAITCPWVQYSPGRWAATPVSEQRDPATAMRAFGTLAHSHGLRVIMAPSADLAGGAQGYLRTLAGPAGASGDLVAVPNGDSTTNVSQYRSLYNGARAAAKAANPGVIVDSEVSTASGTPAQVAAAARSVSADGYVVESGGSAATAQVLDLMEAAGY